MLLRGQLVRALQAWELSIVSCPVCKLDGRADGLCLFLFFGLTGFRRHLGPLLAVSFFQC